ncbi:MAG: chorismate dehydratase [Myxococcota bacterium]|jgi:chorismate dehydratase
MFRIGTVPYQVAQPLTAGLDSNPSVELIIAPPAQLAEMLANEQLDCALASSVLSLGDSDFSIWADGPVIASIGSIKSVLLMLRPGCKSLSAVKTWCADPHSRTGRKLAEIVLRESKIDALMRECDIDEAFAGDADAVQIIGDPAFAAIEKYPEWTVIDLGEEWFKLTHLPFVFAGWIFKDATRFAEIAPLLSVTAESNCPAYAGSGLQYHLELSQVELSLQQLAQWI